MKTRESSYLKDFCLLPNSLNITTITFFLIAKTRAFHSYHHPALSRCKRRRSSITRGTVSGYSLIVILAQAGNQEKRWTGTTLDLRPKFLA
jgi:hypothetical protein